ncbi:MAG TPA: ABC transporter permease [Chitinophagaceae bacterium]|nr:ABC transporter permease [Chitinophagaceae bacterium]
MPPSLKTLFRRLGRYRLFTVLNVLGLAIGISACWIIYSIVSYEFSFDKKLPDRERTYRLVTGFIFDEKESYNGGVSAPLYQGIREQVNGLNRVVPVYGKWVNTIKIERPGTEPLVVDDPKNIVATDSSYFGMVPYTWLAGNKTTAFNAPENVVLTQSRAKSYFGDQQPSQLIGKTIAYNDTIQKTISGIVKDLDYPTEFAAQEFWYLKPKVYELNVWTNTNGSDRVYLQLEKSADTAKVLSQISALATRKWNEFEQDKKMPFKVKRWYELLSMSDSHFSSYIKEYDQRKASKPVIYGLIGLGGFLLILACINYINLSTALVPQRSKEIGVRKVLGSGRKALIGQILAETLATVIMAVVLAFFLAKLGFFLLSDLLPDGLLEHSNTFKLLLFIIPLVLCVTLLSGWYPAWLIAKVQPVSIMRGQGVWTVGNNRLALRKVLIVFQFVIAQAFIVGAMIMGAQLSYAVKKDMGFDKDAVVLVDVPWKLLWKKEYEDKHFALTDELKKESGINMISLGQKPMMSGYSSSMYEYSDGDATKEPVKRQVFRKEVDTSYIPLYEIKLLAGRNLLPSDTTREFVINETAVRAFGFSSPQDAIGKMIGQPGGKYPIVGVVKDFHMQDFHNTIDPMALMANKSNLSTLNIKLNDKDPGKWQQTLKNIEKKWNAFYPVGTFKYKFYDQELETMYKQERNLSRLINMATVIAIIISCLGLFGLAIITSFQRTKEIGIRKVLGASVTGIVRILSSDFVKLVLIALVIASPIAWWVMSKWLQDYAYRIDIKWWMFAAAGFGAVCIALLTVGFHAIKAAVANPVKALRSE